MLKYIFLLFSIFSFSQTKQIVGIVTDNLNIPLESANIIAKPLQEKATLKFAITDNKGRYRLELDSEIRYEITVSYIGFKDQTVIIELDQSTKSYDFMLESTGEQLKEIVIKHNFKPIIVKKDTIVYDVKSFANGNERKLKEQLEKLPGVEVDKNGGVTVQGKKVTKFMVEGDLFFGGGSKLGVENIPANAVDKVEVIDHFNNIGFLKQVSDSDDLAMNIKLKEDKKKFLFGDIEAAAEVANDNDFNLVHSGLFYYNKKSNISFIGDINSIGRSTFGIEDLIRFEGGASSFLTGRKSLSNLYAFINNNSDLILNKSQFSALNFNFKTTSKIEASGYALFSKIVQKSQVENKINYFQNNSITFEDRSQYNSNRSLIGLGNIKLDYSANEKEKWYYNFQYQSTTNNTGNTINSVTNLNVNSFENISEADNNSVKQFIEWHKKHNAKQSTTFVVNHSYEKKTPENNWITNQPFFTGLIPLQDDSIYNIQQIKKIANNSLDALFKHYFIINNYNHLYTSIGNNYVYSNYTTSEKQELSDGGINDFSLNGFGNDIHYRLNDAYIGLEYKFKIGKWTNKPSVYLHLFELKTEQRTIFNSLCKTLFQPQWNSDYQFNKSESISFNYRLENDFPEANQLLNQFTLQSFNSVFKGNALLQNERYHSANIRYSKMNMYKGINSNASVNFNKKVRTTRDIVELIGINQFSTPILTDNPETNWSFYGSVSKKIYRFSLKLNSNLQWFNYIQSINNVISNNYRNNQNFGLSIKTVYKKWPDVSVEYNKGYSQLKGISNSSFSTDEFVADIEFNFLKHFSLKIDYLELINRDNNNQSNYYSIANTSIRYQKRNSPLGFELFVNNLFDNKIKYNYTFSDYSINESSTFVMPRIIMFSLSYKI